MVAQDAAVISGEGRRDGQETVSAVPWTSHLRPQGNNACRAGGCGCFRAVGAIRQSKASNSRLGLERKGRKGNNHHELPHRKGQMQRGKHIARQHQSRGICWGDPTEDLTSVRQSKSSNSRRGPARKGMKSRGHYHQREHISRQHQSQETPQRERAAQGPHGSWAERQGCRVWVAQEH